MSYGWRAFALLGLLAAVSACGPDVAPDAPATVITTSPTGTAYVPGNLRPTLAKAASDQPVVYRNGCHRDRTVTAPKGCLVGPAAAPRVVLFGDSHAAQWYPAFAALADQGRIRLDTRTKSSCPSVEVAAPIPTTPPKPYPACIAWRRAVVADLRADPPAVVVLANFSPSYNPRQSDRGTTWERAIDAMLGDLPASSRAVVVADTPRPGPSLAPCLAKHRDDTAACDAARDEMLDPVTRSAEASAVRDHDATYADFTDLLCNRETCPAILGNTLVYRDLHHLTATFSADLAGQWRRVLVSAGAPID